MSQKKLMALVGPTGAGKTAMAVRLAESNQFEIISADSRQVYRGMDVATGKETNLGVWREINGRRTLIIHGVPIHGLDVVEPNQPFSVADWYRLARSVINEIVQRGNQPLIVGGTGFYVDALAGRISSLTIPPDPELRLSLAELPIENLQQRLAAINLDRLKAMNDSDRRNPARLIRAIETSSRMAATSSQGKTTTGQGSQSFDISLFGLTMSRPQLLARVDGRIEAMIEQGLIEETKRLIEAFGINIPAMSGIGYREMGQYLLGDIGLDQAIELMKRRTRHYIKRQYTWFNHRPVAWVDVEKPDSALVIAKMVRLN